MDSEQLNRASLYCRVSTEEQKEGHNIESQIAELERFAREHGWPITGIYQDDGWSGSLLVRPELDRLRDDAGKRLFDVVLINDVDRLARDVTHLGIIKRDLERNGVRVVFRKLPSEKNPTHNLMVNILGSFAEFEREMIADRTRRGKRHKVEARQQYIGAIPPFGYSYRPGDKAAGKDGLLMIATDEARVVRQMFHWVDVDGLSARAVMGRLNKMGVPTRHRRSRWAKSSVLRILHSETYSGIWHYNKLESCEPASRKATGTYRRSLKSSSRLRKRSEWIPVPLAQNLRLISREQWLRVQAQLKKNFQFSLRNSIHPYLLRGLVQCGGCQAAYCGDPVHGRFYYRCSKRCKQRPTLTESCLDNSVWETVRRLLLAPNLIVENAKALETGRRRNAESAEQEARDAREGLDSLRSEESRLLEAYRVGALDPFLLGKELEQINARRASFETRLQALLSAKLIPVDVDAMKQNVQVFCDSVVVGLNRLDLESRQRLLRLVVRKVVIEDEGHIRIVGQIPIQPSVGPTALADPTVRGPNSGNATDEPVLRPDLHLGGITGKETGCRARNPSESVGFEVVSQR
jgi:site-specific DNA recombinase